MSNVIHIETNPINSETFEFIQTWVNGNNNLDERYLTEKHEDRMAAAIVNIGKAARWFVDTDTVRGSICIITDRDGTDERFGGEHDTLFNAIVSRDDYQKNRLKYALLYGSHVSRLDRIRDYADANEISFTQNAKALEDVVFHGQELKANVLPMNQAPGFWNEKNLTKIFLSGARNQIVCQLCGASAMFQQKDSFTAFTVWNEKTNKQNLISSNKAFIKFFLESHLFRHGIKI